MGFSEHNVSLVPDSYLNSRTRDEPAVDDDMQTAELSDQEILEKTEAIYFKISEDVSTGIYELKVGRSLPNAFGY